MTCEILAIFKMAFAFTTSWRAAPADWPASLGELWKTDFARFNKPRFCKSGAACLYDGCCTDVHPGEDGALMRFLPNAPHKNRRTGRMEPSQIRLFCADGAAAPYYARRAARKSWAEWSAEHGLPSPQSFLAPPAPAAADPDIQGVVEFTEEELELAPFTLAAEASLHIRAQREAEERAAAERLAQQERELREQAARLAQQQQMFQQWMAWQQQVFLWQQQMVAQQQRAPSEAEQKAALGDQLFPIIQDALDRSAADRAVIGFSGPLFTAGKVTGMLLEALSVAELTELLTDDAGLSDLIGQACETLAAASAPAAPVLRPASEIQSATGCSVAAAAAADTVRELVEDIRREEAGLPRLERPAMTVYEAAEGGVLIHSISRLSRPARSACA